MLELNASAAAGAPARKTAYDHDQTPDAQIIKTIETGRILPHRAAGALYGVAVLKGTTTDGSTTWRASDLYVGSSATQETDDSHELVRRRLQNHAITVTDKSKAAALAKVFTALKELHGSTAVRGIHAAPLGRGRALGIAHSPQRDAGHARPRQRRPVAHRPPRGRASGCGDNNVEFAVQRFNLSMSQRSLATRRRNPELFRSRSSSARPPWRACSSLSGSTRGRPSTTAATSHPGLPTARPTSPSRWRWVGRKPSLLVWERLFRHRPALLGVPFGELFRTTPARRAGARGAAPTGGRERGDNVEFAAQHFNGGEVLSGSE